MFFLLFCLLRARESLSNSTYLVVASNPVATFDDKSDKITTIQFWNSYLIIYILIVAFLLILKWPVMPSHARYKVTLPGCMMIGVKYWMLANWGTHPRVPFCPTESNNRYKSVSRSNSPPFVIDLLLYLIPPSFSVSPIRCKGPELLFLAITLRNPRFFACDF